MSLGTVPQPMNGPLDHVLRFLRRKFSPTGVRGAADDDLLPRYVEQCDEVAFARLVKAHRPMVLSVCRRILGNAPNAEGVFQAVFLVLVRKARAFAQRALLANWLYGVAYRTARPGQARAE